MNRLAPHIEAWPPTALYAQADDTGALVIALGTTRSTINALRTPMNREKAANTTAGKRRQWSVVSGRWSPRRRHAAFTLAELLVSMGVLVLLVLLFTQLLNSAATVTILGHKLMDADSEARQVFDRMAIDFAQMVKRSDVDYFAKGTAAPNSVGGTMAGNDQIAFYGAVPGYYPSTGSKSPISLVAYRLNSQNKLERMGVGLVWNGVSTADTPVVFLPLTIAASWPSATDLTASPTPEPRAEVIGPQVFRFEYYYLLKGQVVSGTTYNPIFTDTPWDTRISGHTNISSMRDVAAIIADIAVVDPKSRVLLIDAQIATLAGTLIDYGGSAAANCPSPDWQAPGELRRQWQCALDSTVGLPRATISGIRVYERSFYLNQ